MCAGRLGGNGAIRRLWTMVSNNGRPTRQVRVTISSPDDGAIAGEMTFTISKDPSGR